MNNKNNKNDKKLRVGLIIADPYISKEVIYTNNGKKLLKYGGLIYEIWNRIKYINNWEDKVKEIPYKPDYDTCVKAVHENKVDIMVGNIWIFEERMKMVNFTRPLFLSKIVIAYKPTKSILNTYLEVSYENYIKPIFYMLLVGITSGIFLYYIEPRRGFRRAIWSSIATLFGEAGYLFENSTLRMKGMMYVVIFISIAYMITMILQGIVTRNIIEITRDTEINKNNLSSKNLMISKNLDIGEILSKYDINYDTIDIQFDESAKYYLDNMSKYDGYLTEYEHTKIDKKNYPEIITTKDNFGYEENAFAIRKELSSVAHDINIAITKLQSSDKIKDICTKYIGEIDSELCIL